MTTLEQRISEVLYYVWDPIGVKDKPIIRDEYDKYIPELIRMAKTGYHNPIFQRLEFIETEFMELGWTIMHPAKRDARKAKASELIHYWHKVLA